jgi:hypothetical protein
VFFARPHLFPQELRPGCVVQSRQFQPDKAPAAKGEIASLSGAQDDPRYFQISVPVQPGNSGGALVDEHGNVVGLVSAKLKAPVTVDRKFEDVVKSAQDAAVLVLVY